MSNLHAARERREFPSVPWAACASVRQRWTSGSRPPPDPFPRSTRYAGTSFLRHAPGATLAQHRRREGRQVLVCQLDLGVHLVEHRGPEAQVVRTVGSTAAEQ